MVLAIGDEEIAKMLSMDEAVGVLRRAYGELAADDAVNSPRVDLAGLGSASVSSDREDSAYLLKTMSGITSRYASIRFLSEYIRWRAREGGELRRERAKPGKFSPTRGSILLFDRRDAKLLAVLSEGVIRNMRVGATAALAADYLCRPGAELAAIIGSGFMARAHLRALSLVRPIKRAKIYSPSIAHRESCAAEMSQLLGIDVSTAPSLKDAIRDADLIALTTNVIEPVFHQRHLREGVHVSCVRHCEIDDECYRAFDKVYLNAKDNAGILYRIAGLTSDQIPPDFVVQNYQQGYPGDDAFWRDRSDLIDLVSGRALGRESKSESTCFDNSTGFAVQFTALAGRIYELARERGLGTTMPDDLFPGL
jgi:ornithine cyclodeaminase/alanine dehydrogenase-like protein (mu-crystallin family)